MSDATAQATAHPGVTLKTGGVISGKPTVTGTFKITLSAKVGTGKAATQAFSLVVKSRPSDEPRRLNKDPAASLPGPQAMVTRISSMMSRVVSGWRRASRPTDSPSQDVGTTKPIWSWSSCDDHRS